MYFVYHDAGSCNYGDHDTGFAEFATLSDVEAYIAKLKERCYDGVDIRVIEGRELQCESLLT